METKTVVLPNGKEFDIPESHNWIAMDKDKTWWSYDAHPMQSRTGWIPVGVIHLWRVFPITKMSGPFETGNWTTQIYWVED